MGLKITQIKILRKVVEDIGT